jgi:hypothetical protein
MLENLLFNGLLYKNRQQNYLFMISGLFTALPNHQFEHATLNQF